MRILITAPLRQDKRIFREYQKSLDRLIIPEGFTADRLFIVNDCPEIIPEIRNAMYIIHDTGDAYDKTDESHLWTGKNLAKMSALRNMSIVYALANDYDYWFSADTDLVLNPHTLEYLLAADKDIISEVFWTKSDGGKIWPNAWMYDQSDYGDGLIEKLAVEGVHQVGMTGACVLVKRRVFERGVGYAPIPNIKNAFVGEDRHFCVRAACAGFDLWADTHVPPVHLYTEEAYLNFMEAMSHAERDKESPENQHESV